MRAEREMERRDSADRDSSGGSNSRTDSRSWSHQEGHTFDRPMSRRVSTIPDQGLGPEAPCIGQDRGLRITLQTETEKGTENARGIDSKAVTSIET